MLPLSSSLFRNYSLLILLLVGVVKEEKEDSDDVGVVVVVVPVVLPASFNSCMSPAASHIDMAWQFPPNVLYKNML